MKHRNFVYVGESIPPIDRQKNFDFIVSVQKAMLLSLIKRNLITHQQMEQVMEIIKKKNIR